MTFLSWKTNRRFILGCLLVSALVATGLSIFWNTPRTNPSEIHNRARRIADREGIVVGFGSPDTFFVPPYSSAEAGLHNGQATAIVDLGTVPPALDGLDAALSFYPPGFFRENCNAIFLCGSLFLDGSEAGGTWKETWIILSASNLFDIRETVQYGVHHELSSLIWSRFPDLRARWGKLLPTGWTPASRNSEALKASGDLAANAEYGFLSPYGATSSENDFNTYAETAIMNPVHLAAQAEKHPIVAKKLALLMDTYVQLDNRFEAIFARQELWRFQSSLPAPIGEGISISPSFIPPGRIIPQTGD